MNKILVSAGVLVFMGTVAVGATGAFFSDTETSTGNTFTAGAIDLTVDNTQHYNNAVCVPTSTGPAGTWQLAQGATTSIDQYPVIGSPCDGTWTNPVSLGPTFKFFNFGDVKPGDDGEDTVSLHVVNNPFYACADFVTTGNNENTRIDPEVKAGDLTDDPNGGELAQHIEAFAWLDNGTSSPNQVAGDNIWQANEPQLFGPVTLANLINSTTTITLADGGLNGGVPLQPGPLSFIGINWCAGSTTISSPGVFTCSGATMGNDTQTDSATTTVSFRVIQSRNNSAFRCRP